MELKNNIWKFPTDIKIEEVAGYMREFDKLPQNCKYIFDLSETTYIHSAYIGFLIHVKQKLEKSNGDLVLKISPTVEKIFHMLNLTDFFPCI